MTILNQILAGTRTRLIDVYLENNANSPHTTIIKDPPNLLSLLILHQLQLHSTATEGYIYIMTGKLWTDPTKDCCHLSMILIYLK